MSLQQSLPWTRSPLIINAPMGGFALAHLAIAVTCAGGLGMIGADDDLISLQEELHEVKTSLGEQDGHLPIGVGFLSFILHRRMDEVVALLAKFRPAVVWLFAEKELPHYADWTTSIRKAVPGVQIWIQTCSVAAGLEIARTAKPNVICAQGSDAGGHGYEAGAGIISLLPELSDALAASGHHDIFLVGAGGIVKPRSAAAALALGASGVVLGTRFLFAEETKLHPLYQRAVLAANDGGQSTKRSKIYDQLRGPNRWPVVYNGRSLRIQSLKDFEDGVSLDDIQARFAEASKTDALGFAEDGTQGRAAMWAGTGVGLVTKRQPAGDIVEEVRSGIERVLNDTKSRL